MNKQTVQKKPETCDYSLLLFDGACNLCSSAVQFIIRRDPARRFRFASCV
nr:DCC1-like thiol-disulfide oxidoreductase family protein [Paenibacillus larvae]